MDVIRSDDYHDYVILGDRFIGEFEQMYQNCEDPWHQDADGLSEREPLRRIVLEEIRSLGPKHILDVGCGLGYFTNQLRQHIPGAEVLGTELSKTAVSKAAARYPSCQFQELDALKLHLLQKTFDVVVCSELLWYILGDLNLFFKEVASVSHEKTSLVFSQYFPPPEEQRYGRDVIVGVEGFLRLIPFRVVKILEVNRLLSANERERQGKTGSHRVLLLCDCLQGQSR